MVKDRMQKTRKMTRQMQGILLFSHTAPSSVIPTDHIACVAIVTGLKGGPGGVVGSVGDQSVNYACQEPIMSPYFKYRLALKVSFCLIHGVRQSPRLSIVATATGDEQTAPTQPLNITQVFNPPRMRV